MRSIALALMLAFAGATACHAAEDKLLAEAMDLLGGITFLNSGAPGMVLGVVRGDNTFFRFYGAIAENNKQTPDGASLLRVNSITKVFTTELLATLAAEGKLTLTDTLQRFAGNDKVPAFGARPITLLDLATHSAGLPREIGDVPEGVSPRAWPTRADRWTWLRGDTLLWAPQTVAAYSNIGFDLLADALETAGGQPYADLLRSRVTGPLGMVDTGFTPTPEQCARMMVGSGFGGAAPCGDTRATEGSGGLYSTANDMARWLRHNLTDTAGALALGHAIYRPRQAIPAAIGFDEAGPMAGLALGWVFEAADGIQPALLEKSGGGAGFMSDIVFAPGRDVGVFVAVNRVDFPMFHYLTDTVHKLIASLVTR